MTMFNFPFHFHVYAVTAVLSVFFSFFDLRFQSSGFVVIAPESNGDIALAAL